MKTLKLITHIFFLFLAVNLYGQISDQAIEWENSILENEELSRKESKKRVTKYDFAELWSSTDNSVVLGFIGDNFQRLRIKIISASKDKNSSDTYDIFGKSMVKNSICEFNGTIKIIKARIYKKMHWGVDDEFRNTGIKKQGIMIAKYHFSEDSKGLHSGLFDGLLLTAWYIDKNGNLKYDDIEKESDSYTNNQFVGTWKKYEKNLVKVANWGDYRIPFSGDLDGGAGAFSPDEKYSQFGWQIYQDAYFRNNKRARQEEEKQWWK